MVNIHDILETHTWSIKALSTALHRAIQIIMYHDYGMCGSSGLAQEISHG